MDKGDSFEINEKEYVIKEVSDTGKYILEDEEGNMYLHTPPVPDIIDLYNKVIESELFNYIDEIYQLDDKLILYSIWWKNDYPLEVWRENIRYEVKTIMREFNVRVSFNKSKESLRIVLETDG
jgi:hypothetical protein